MAPDLIRQMVSDGDLEEVTGDPFVSEDRPRIFDGGANVEVAALRVVRGDEVEATVVDIVKTGRIHEATGAGRLERFRKLTDEERPDVIGDGDEPLLLEEVDHLLLSALIRGQECLLIGWDAFGALRIGIGERRVGKHRLQRPVSGQLDLAEVGEIV